MSVRSVLAETDISGDVERGKGFPQNLDGLDDRAVGVVCKSSRLVLSGPEKSMQGESGRARP